MKKYSQKTIPMQSGELIHTCPICGQKYRAAVRTGIGWLFVHEFDIVCREDKDENTS